MNGKNSFVALSLLVSAQFAIPSWAHAETFSTLITTNLAIEGLTGDNRGNLAAGAKGVGRPLDDRDRWLCERIGPALRERGMLFVGLDVIGGYVTEINVTSPTGVRELDRQFELDIAGSLMDAVAARVAR